MHTYPQTCPTPSSEKHRGIVALFRSGPLLLATAFLLFGLFPVPQGANAADSEALRSHTALLLGYGSSYPGWGATKVRVETVDAIFRYELPKPRIIGSSWYKGYHSLFLEVPVDFMANRSGSPMVGVSFLAAYTFTDLGSIRPYVFAGGGPTYVPADIPGMGSHWNGHYQAGIGLQYPLSDNHSLLFEVRYHHISNMGIKDPNDPLNSLKFLIGYTF